VGWRRYAPGMITSGSFLWSGVAAVGPDVKGKPAYGPVAGGDPMTSGPPAAGKGT